MIGRSFLLMGLILCSSAAWSGETFDLPPLPPPEESGSSIINRNSTRNGPMPVTEELWKQEFSDICSRTDEVMSFSRDELKMLLQRGNKLRIIIEALEETPRKIYLKRLQKCMNLYSFVLESMETDKKQ